MKSGPGVAGRRGGALDFVAKPVRVPGSVGSTHVYRAMLSPQELWAVSKLSRQILEQLTRDPKVRRFESFRKAVVHAGQRTPSLIALSPFRQQLSQGGC